MKNLMKKIMMGLFIVFMMMLQVPSQAAQLQVLPTMKSEYSAPNRVWVGTFQLVWNELSDNLVKGAIEFEDYRSLSAELLNEKEFNKHNVDSSAYYIKYGTVSPKLKKTITSGIKRKFKEKSDILDSFDWTFAPNKYLVYAMLKKDFKFERPFDKLQPSAFGSNYTSVDYFGINSSSSKALYENVEVLFYNSSSDFAVKLKTKGNDDVILYRTNANRAFDKYYSDVIVKTQKYTDSRRFQYYDTLAVPDINLYKQQSFSDLEGHAIKGTNFIIDKTIETVDFKMNNEGVKLKSEAAIMTRLMSLPPARARNFNFNDRFVLFLVEKGQNVPYFAMRVADIESLNSAKK